MFRFCTKLSSLVESSPAPDRSRHGRTGTSQSANCFRACLALHLTAPAVVAQEAVVTWVLAPFPTPVRSPKGVKSVRMFRMGILWNFNDYTKNTGTSLVGTLPPCADAACISILKWAHTGTNTARYPGLTVLLPGFTQPHRCSGTPCGYPTVTRLTEPGTTAKERMSGLSNR